MTSDWRQSRQRTVNNLATAEVDPRIRKWRKYFKKLGKPVWANRVQITVSLDQTSLLHLPHDMTDAMMNWRFEWMFDPARGMMSEEG